MEMFLFRRCFIVLFPKNSCINNNDTNLLLKVDIISLIYWYWYLLYMSKYFISLLLRPFHELSIAKQSHYFYIFLLFCKAKWKCSEPIKTKFRDYMIQFVWARLLFVWNYTVSIVTETNKSAYEMRSTLCLYVQTIKVLVVVWGI